MVRPEALMAVADQVQRGPYDQSDYRRCIAGIACTLIGWRVAEHSCGSLWTDGRSTGTVWDVAKAVLGDVPDALLDPLWRPARGLTVPDALRRLAKGASFASVSDLSLMGEEAA